MGGGSLLQRINGQQRILGKDEVRAGKRLTLSSRTSDRRHRCGVCPAGTIRFPRPAWARALHARSCWAAFVCISFPSRGSGKRNQGIDQCLHWFMHMPPACADMIRICQQRKKNTAGPMGLRCFSGAAGQIRTADLILTKDALYLLSYSSKVHAPYWGHVWRPRRDLNPRPPA